MNMIAISRADKIAALIEPMMARLSTAFARPEKPASLVKAEMRVRDVQELLVSANAQYLRTLNNGRGNRHATLTAATAREAELPVTRCKKDVEAARDILCREQAEYSANLQRTLIGATTEARELLLELLDAADEVATLMRDVHNYAVMNGLEPSRAIAQSPYLQAHIRKMKEIL